jgi:hypothetical protein
LAEVGVRPSDVFGADAILWVEGLTEERSFPLIVEHLLKRPLMGIKIIGVAHTNDLEHKDADRLIDIYLKLSHGSRLIPQTVGFVIDREQRSQAERNLMRKRVTHAGGKIEFTRRRMYENYLLNAGAIAHVLSEADDSREEVVTAEDVEQRLEQIWASGKHVPGGVQVSDEIWVEEVHGARVLADIFNDLTDCRVAYEKTRYGPKLTQWLIENEPDALGQIATLLASMLPAEP